MSMEKEVHPRGGKSSAEKFDLLVMFYPEAFRLAMTVHQEVNTPALDSAAHIHGEIFFSFEIKTGTVRDHLRVRRGDMNTPGNVVPHIFTIGGFIGPGTIAAGFRTVCGDGVSPAFIY